MNQAQQTKNQYCKKRLKKPNRVNLRKDRAHFLMFRVSPLANPVRFSVRPKAWSLVALSELRHTGIGVAL